MGPKNAVSRAYRDALQANPAAPKNSKRWASAKEVTPPTPTASESLPKPSSLLEGLKAAVKKTKTVA
ncbi:hypothetical protein PsYK624_063150 [Phanerochaete sordida]|uniref:Uncharacterized protein n=1 Tax=Phanerochaete sordida TaxID=48140 RepID=A0A9P3LD35_9APHY|nr:hypothetical protein PsYK624_063150 [Phanerochaete sordida]